MSVYGDGGAPYPPVTGREPCTRVDPEIFFSSPARAAKWVCRACPVREQCLAYALTHDVKGVWGGTGEDQREEFQRRQKIRPVSINPFPPLDPQMAVRAHERGMPHASIAKNAGVTVDAVAAVLLTWRKQQREEVTSP